MNMTPQEFVNKLKKQADEIRTLVDRTLPVKVGNEAVEHFKENFERGGFVDNGLNKWLPAKRLSSKYGDKKNKTLLSGRNHLRDSIEAEPISGGVKIVNRVEYAAAHNEGTNNAGRGRNVTIPKRQFIGDSKELDGKIREIIDKEIEKRTK